MIKYENAVRNIHHHVHVVLDEQNGEAIAVQLADDGGNADSRVVGNAGSRLVEHQKARPGGERPGHFQEVFCSPNPHARGGLLRAINEP